MTNGEYFVLTHPDIKVEENGTCVWIYNLDSTICNHHTMSMEWWNEEMVDIRPKGKWIIHNDYNENCRYGCDQCGNLTNRNSSFCPNCGADMRGDV